MHPFIKKIFAIIQRLLKHFTITPLSPLEKEVKSSKEMVIRNLKELEENKSKLALLIKEMESRKKND